jgi:hypothetical protein
MDVKNQKNRKLGVNTPGKAGSAFNRKGSATKDVTDTYRVNSRVDASDTKPDLPPDHIAHLAATTSKKDLQGGKARRSAPHSGLAQRLDRFLRALVCCGGSPHVIGLAPRPSSTSNRLLKQSQKKQLPSDNT